MDKKDSSKSRPLVESDMKQVRSILEQEIELLVDKLMLGIVFDTYHKHKNGILDLLAVDTTAPPESSAANPYVDIFGHSLKKNQECLCSCPNCDRTVSASRFAPHLADCMGMGRRRSRNATKRVAHSSKERENPAYSGVTSDDEDDADWNSVDKRRKKKERNNGSKKSKGTNKKSTDSDTVESANVDIEGDEDGLGNWRDLLQDSSNASSPADSVGSSGSTKKKEKSKSKKSSRKDRSSPNNGSID